MALRQLARNQAEFWDLFRFSWDVQAGGLPKTLSKVTEHCAECFQASGASLFLRKNDSQWCELAARTGRVQMPRDARIKVGEGIAGAAIELGRPLAVSDPTEHPSLFGKSVSRRDDVGSAMVVPLLTHGSCIGVMNFSRGPGAQPFSQKDLVRAESVVRHIALAIENARLFSELSYAAEEAKRVQTRFHEILQHLGVAILVVDEAESITEVNREALRMLGREAGEHEYKGLLSSVLQALHEANEGGQLRRRYHDEQSGRSWSLSCAPLTSGGATAALEEITEHEEAQRELARLNRLAEIGQMTAAIAHEIRNPLTSIAAASSVIQVAPEQSAELGKMIEEEALKLNLLCDQFLEFAKPLSLRLSEVSLNDVARRLAKQHKAEFDRAGVTLKLDTRRTSTRMTVDVIRLEMAIRNLVLNALQASRPGGTVVVKVTPFGFEVSDQGKGMSAETLERLFTPFFTTRPKGTGLGLCTTRKVIEAHGGRIDVTSSPGHGSVFTVQIGEVKA